ncbi:RagB/SusD family nutrient uptake outer membrane protein [Pedobacter insulae]|uniref:SusD family protein n=1 Tax=Pedobacter insulae TaxID=414048 RepID=A0A1I2XJT8_9SPHI|nr:RagB/SusD family nutrient uptake outer membrane protein [Pedobacter insulae]SFH12341.1 SusD family protein [Pedobacter insulae]
MKLNNKIIFTILLVALFATSCKKGWLDVTSSSEIRAEDQFTSESGFKDALIGVYIGMTDRSLYASQLTWGAMDLISHQYQAYPASAGYFQFQNHNYRSTEATPQVDAIWNKTYNVIADINNALGHIDKNKSALNPISYSIIKGELLGLRAFLHFDLMRIYGHGNISGRTDLSGKLAIPYVMVFDKVTTPQLSYNETFALLLKDVETASQLLKEDPIYNNPRKPSTYYAEVNRDGFFNNREQRMNYYALKGLKGRVLQWMGGTQNLAEAALSAEEVIQYSDANLATSTAAATDPRLYSEHLFNLNVMGLEDIINRYLNANDATNNDALLILPQTAQTLYETSNPNIGLVDIRYNTLLASGNRGLVSIKLKQVSAQPHLNIVPLMKLPEMYYIAAENYIKTNLPKAIAYLNIVRKSRGIIQDIAANSTQLQLTEELTKEYRKEYISEGQLFFYYKRLGFTTIPNYTGVVNDNIYVLPYPQAEIEFGQRRQ